MELNMRKMGDLVFSEHVMLTLIHAGMSRDAAYKVAQRNAAKAWEGQDFKEAVLADPDVTSRLSEAEALEMFSLEHHLRNRRHTLRAVGLGT
jgi:adenylosuccinate lyase